MNRFIHRAKKKKAGTVFCLVFVAALIVSGALLWRDYSHAADEADIWIENERGLVVNPAENVIMSTSSMQLILGSSKPAYADEDRYKVEWSIEDSAARDVIASIEQSPTNKMIAIVRALSPGNVTITVTVKDSSEGDAVLGTTTCNINVIFAIDTSTGANMYGEEERYYVSYADDAPVNLGLNFGNAEDAEWSSSNTEIVKVERNTGLMTPVGAGRALVTATYSPPGDSTTIYTAVLNVYIKPKVSTTNGGPYLNRITNLKLPSGSNLYTDTVFTNNTQAIRNKITWVVKKDDGQGNPVVIADSLGKESDLIQITPSGMYSNELKIEGVAGNYSIEFYTNGTYTEGVEIEEESGFSPTVVTFTLTAKIGDKEETLGSGDSYDLAAAFGMTTEDFVKCFVSNNWTKDGGSIYNYATYDSQTAVLTIKNNVSEGVLLDTVTVKPAQKAYVAELLGLDSNNEDDLNNMPMSFQVTINLKDQLRLSATALTLSEKATYQLTATYNGTYDEPVRWTSSDPKYVTVDDNGMLTAVKNTVGDVIITASLTNTAGKTITATCLVVVEPALSSFSLEPNVTEMSMFVGESTTIKAVIKQAITNAPLSWTCSTANSNIFSVVAASDGKSAVVTATGTGIADLIVENTVSGDRKTIRITVRSSIQSISLKNTEMSIPFYKEGYNMGKNDVSWNPTNATDTDLIWSSSDSSVATVDEDGYITFNTAGVTLITVRPDSNPNGVMASCLLTIVGTANNVKFSENNVTMNVGDSQNVLVDFEPVNTVAELSWEIEDSKLVTTSYDEERKIATLTGKSPGTTTINVKSQAGIYSIKVNVKQPSTGITLSPKEVTVRTGDTTSVKATLTPGNSTDTIQWSTLNARVATVNAEGVVTGVSSGTTFIRAQAYNGKIPGATEIVQVVVRDGVKGIALDSLEKSVTVGSSISLVPIFTPESAFDKGMTWTSSNPSVAKVELSGTSNGKVTGVAPGIALITGTANDGKFTVACLVTVKAKAIANDTKVTLKPTTKYLKLRKTFYITATVTGTSNKKVKWSTSKKSVATVTSDGKVKGKKVGTAYIKATAQDGSGAYARCKVRVVRMAKKIKLNKSTAKVLVGSTLKLKATITPKNATIKKVKWSSSNNSIATVSSSGRVLGVSPGIVKIKAKATDGSGKSATCILTVQEPVEATGVTVENGSITVAKGKAVQSGIVAAPANTTTKIKYYSDNKKVATVDKRGKIRTKRAGQATIYGETANGKIGYVDVLVVDLNRKGLVMRQYDTEQLHVNEISTGVTWYSKNINVATVDSTGKVTGRKKGTTTIYAVVNGVKLGCRVQIKKIK